MQNPSPAETAACFSMEGQGVRQTLISCLAECIGRLLARWSEERMVEYENSSGSVMNFLIHLFLLYLLLSIRMYIVLILTKEKRNVLNESMEKEEFERKALTVVFGNIMYNCFYSVSIE